MLGPGQDVREGAAHGGAQHLRLLHGLGVPGGRHPGLLPAQGLGRLQHLQNARPLVSVAPAAWYWCASCLMMLGLMNSLAMGHRRQREPLSSRLMSLS